MGVRFQLLGAVECSVDGIPLAIGHPRQRSVLAILLVEANRPVRTELLIDRVWGDTPPNQARAVLSSYVSRLRGSFDTIPDEAKPPSLIRRSGGYALHVDPDQVDLHLFRRLVIRSQRLDDAQAAELLSEALALWRGAPFEDADSPWLHDLRQNLEQERLASALRANDIALANGRHAQLVGSLHHMHARQPHDERLAGQLMLALYRCGRAADALNTYQRMRTRLVDELGIEPGPALQDLHQRILAAEPSLELPAADSRSAAQRPSGGSVPAQLPADIRAFIGRTQYLRQLDELAAEHNRPGNTALVICTIAGTAGVGKTTLAVHWGRQHLDRFCDGQLYVNLRGFAPSGAPMSPDEAIRGFLDAFQIAPEKIPRDLDGQAALYRSLLENRRMLIILDNARDTDQVRPLLPGSPTCLVVITSRQQLTGLIARNHARQIALDILDPAEARDLLTSFLGPERVSAAGDGMDKLIELCARLPIALTIAAARAVTNPHVPLDEVANELAELSTDDSQETDVRSIFSWSYRALSPGAAALFRLLGIHPGPDIDLYAAASLAAVPVPRARGLLNELTLAHLLHEHTSGRYRFHDLLRSYATEQVVHDERRPALHRVLDYYVHTAFAAALLLDPNRKPIALADPQPGITPRRIEDYRQAMDWFTVERSTLSAAVDEAVDHLFPTHAWQLPWTLTDFLNRRGHWSDIVSLQRVAAAAGEQLGDRAIQARAHRTLGHTFTMLKEHTDAHKHLNMALDIFAELDDRDGQAGIHHILSWDCGRQRRYTDAIDHAQQALHLYRTIDNRVGEGRALNALGWHEALLGHHHEALLHCQEALDVFGGLGDRYAQAPPLHNIGYAHHHLGRYDLAVCHYRRALDLLREFGDRYNQAFALTHIGESYLAAGDRSAARDAWQQALVILRELDHADAEQVQNKLAQLHTPADDRFGEHST